MVNSGTNTTALNFMVCCKHFRDGRHTPPPHIFGAHATTTSWITTKKIALLRPVPKLRFPPPWWTSIFSNRDTVSYVVTITRPVASGIYATKTSNINHKQHSTAAFRQTSRKYARKTHPYTQPWTQHHTARYTFYTHLKINIYVASGQAKHQRGGDVCRHPV